MDEALNQAATEIALDGLRELLLGTDTLTEER